MKAVDSFSGVILSGIDYNLMLMMIMMMMTMMKTIKVIIIIMTMMIFDKKALKTDARHDRQMNKHKCK